jgi:hypothetical protein
MKKVFAVIICLFFVATLSFAVVGCKKAEEQKPVEMSAPAPAPAPEAAPASGEAQEAEEAPAQAPEAAPATK